MIHIPRSLIPASVLGMALSAQSAEPSSRLTQVPPPAASTSREVPRYRIPELPTHPLSADGLELWIERFGGPLFGSGGGLLSMSIRIENHTTEFKPFALERLIAVGSDGTQALVVCTSRSVPLTMNVSTLVAPGAHMTLAFCQLSAPVTIPVRIYYGGQLLVEVTGK